ncbi:MAG: hypothetical protein KDA61_11790 [Planctomycetales bacterium]|nr:hypothetical protein [Planctomycetales bacterium]
MTDHADITSEFESLCMAAAQGELSADERRRLEQLLLDKPERQDFYCACMTVESMLRAEFGVHGQCFAPVVPRAAAKASRSDAGVDCVTLARRMNADLQETRGKRARLVMSAAGLAVSAALAWAMIGGQAPSDGDTAPPADFDAQLADSPMRLQNPEMIGMLHRVTNTAWDGSSLRSGRRNFSASGRIFQGAAQLPRFNGQLAGGYVVALPPGASLDLMVDADSDGENALAVMQVDQEGNPTGELISFSNQANATPSALLGGRVYGRLGNWSEHNESDETRYYMLAGMHKRSVTVVDQPWFVTNCAVLIDLPDLLHIGWDDSGWLPPDADFTPKPDNDFNDVSATIRIKLPTDDPSRRQAVRSYPMPEYREALPEWGVDESHFTFEVPPGMGVIIGVSSEARYPNAVSIVERKVNRVWWRRDNSQRKDRELATCLIENRGDSTLEFCLVGEHRISPDERLPWIPSEYQIVRQAARCQVVGFDDGGAAIGPDNDWNDLLVSFHWMPL